MVQKGEIRSLMSETNEVQKRLKKAAAKKEETREKAFVRLMMFGKIGPAAKFINNEDAVKGVHSLNDEITNILQAKHPEKREVDPEIIIEHHAQTPEPIIFEEITAEKVQKVVRNMTGSGGPTLIDADTWKDFLCSKAFNSRSQMQLCQGIADLTKRQFTEEIESEWNLTEFEHFDQFIG